MKAFVVSGAGSGIGKAICQKLADDTDRLYLVGRREQQLKETVATIDDRVDCRIISCDISQKEQCQFHLKNALAQEKDLCGVIANAGVGGENHYGPNDRWDEIININLSGTYHFVNACYNSLQKSTHEYRHVVIVSSILSRLGVSGYTAYCASKAGLLGLTRSWATQWASQRILVNAIAPGWVATEMAVQGLAQIAHGSGRSYNEIEEEQMTMVPLGKMSVPEEIGALISFLVSSDQNSMTGQTLDINNGALMP